MVHPTGRHSQHKAMACLKEEMRETKIPICLIQDQMSTVELIESFKKVFLSTYYVPGRVAGTGDTAETMKADRKPYTREVCVPFRRHEQLSKPDA